MACESDPLTTKPDHNRTRHVPISTDALVAQHQVSDCLRQAGRTLQAGGLPPRARRQSRSSRLRTSCRAAPKCSSRIGLH